MPLISQFCGFSELRKIILPQLKTRREITVLQLLLKVAAERKERNKRFIDRLFTAAHLVCGCNVDVGLHTMSIMSIIRVPADAFGSSRDASRRCGCQQFCTLSLSRKLSHLVTHLEICSFSFHLCKKKKAGNVKLVLCFCLTLFISQSRLHWRVHHQLQGTVPRPEPVQRLRGAAPPIGHCMHTAQAKLLNFICLRSYERIMSF